MVKKSTADEFMDAYRAGDLKKARQWIDDRRKEIAANPLEPDSMTVETGKPPKFKSRGKIVERQPDGTWKHAPKKAKKKPRQ